jgi:hypothetical protein
VYLFIIKTKQNQTQTNTEKHRKTQKNTKKHKKTQKVIIKIYKRTSGKKSAIEPFIGEHLQVKQQKN